jgi:hypothetical protein
MHSSRGDAHLDMNGPEPLITGTDFVFVPTRNFAAAEEFSDPDGNALILHHRYAPRDA